MRTVYYYSDINDTDNNFCDDSSYLKVNCTGRAVYDGATGRSVRRDYYLIYLVKGSISVRSPALERDMMPGDLMIFSPGTPFDYTGIADGELIYYWVHFTGYGAGELIAGCGLEPDRLRSVGMAARIAEAFEALFSAFTQMDGLSVLDRSGVLMRLLILLGREAAANAGTSAGALRARNAIAGSISYIHDNISSPLSVSELAKLEYLSPGRYRELFREATGSSPKDYIINLRINVASNLLTSTDMTVAQISAAAGIPDGRYFSRIFMRKTGKTPTEYRKSEGG